VKYDSWLLVATFIVVQLTLQLFAEVREKHLHFAKKKIEKRDLFREYALDKSLFSITYAEL
jgi:hypothetical protein